MFETVSPDAFVKRQRWVFYESLPISIAVHAIVFGAAFAVAVTRLGFPTEPPRLVTAYALAEPPPPPPPPPAVQTKPQPILQRPQVVAPDKEVAPTMIPETIPQILPVALAASVVEPEKVVDSGAVGGIDGGIAGGVIGGDPIAGVPGGVGGGKPGGILGGFLGEDGRVHFGRNQALPLYVERQDYPEYPEWGRIRGYEDQVVVRYVIGKDGRVKELTVLEHPERKMFESPAVDAIKQWRFRPLLVEGEAREVVHELVVYFRLK
jgi:periplasmic protein TonB